MVARRAHNPKVVGSNPASATTQPAFRAGFFILCTQNQKHRCSKVTVLLFFVIILYQTAYCSILRRYRQLPAARRGCPVP